MSSEEYWIGKGTNYKNIWEDYLNIKEAEIKKFNSRTYFPMQIKFDFPDSSMPVFNHEVIYKTLKGCYHDLEKHCLSSEEYNNSGPLFLNRLERGSGVFEFLGEFQGLIVLSLWLIPSIKNGVIELINQYVEGKRIDNEAKRVALKQEYLNLIERVGNAPIPEEIKTNLIAEYLSSLKISPISFKENIEVSRKELKELIAPLKKISRSN